MANTIRDYSATAAANTTVDGADISEGCSPAGINDAIRGVMADLKDVSTGAVALESPAADSLTVTGTVTADDIAISDSSPTFTMTDTDTNALFRVSASSAVGSVTLEVDENGVGSNPQFLIQGQNVDRFRIDADGGDISFYDSTGVTQGLFWDASAQRLGLGTNAPETLIHLKETTGNAILRINSDGGERRIDFGDATDADGGRIKYDGNDNLQFYTSGTEHMRVTSGGNVGIGTASPDRRLQVKSNENNAANTTIGLAPSTTENVQGGLGVGSGGILGVNAVNTIQFRIGGTDGDGASEVARINSSNNVGIGTASPARRLTLHNSGATTSHIQMTNAATGEAGANGVLFGVNGAGQVELWNYENTDMLFAIGGAVAALIDSNGNFALNGSVRDSSRFTINGNVSNPNLQSWQNTTSGVTHFWFRNPNGIVGSIVTSGSSTAYNTSSDYRLKTAVNYDWDATTRLKQLRPARFEWIADGDDAVPVDGFLAHEVQDIVPEAISGTKDAMRDEEYEVSAATGDIYTPATEAVLDEDGNEVTPAVAEVIHSTDVERPEELAEGQQWRETTVAVMGTRSVPDYQGIDQSKLVPLLVKTIQELEARITALEAN